MKRAGRAKARDAGHIFRAYGATCAGPCGAAKYFPGARTAGHARELLATSRWVLGPEGWVCPACTQRAAREKVLADARAADAALVGAS